jgi:hypothetical protein
MDNGNNFFDVLNLASLIIGIQNLNENREQSAHNDVETANQRQADFMLREINREFGELKRLFTEQNKTLAKICKALEKLEEMEKGENGV